MAVAKAVCSGRNDRSVECRAEKPVRMSRPGVLVSSAVAFAIYTDVRAVRSWAEFF